MSYDAFPQILKEQKQWIVWKFEKVAGKEKPTKVPYKNTAQKAASTNPNDWLSFENCKKLLETNQFNGLGYVFTQGVVGIDLDHCFEEDGFTLKQWAKDIVDLFPSYIEISPSGTGLHIFILCEADFKGAKTYIGDGDIERYCRGRYFTVTGNIYGDYKELKQYDQDFFLKWHNSFIKDNPKKEKQIPQTQQSTLLPDDNKILEVMFKSKHGEKLKDLYQGNWEKYFRKEEKKSQSEADLSFVGSLMFFCQNNTVVADRIFRSSGLMREKWDRKDYREGMFEKCYHLETMNWNNQNQNSPENDVVNNYLPAMTHAELMATIFPPVRYVIDILCEKGAMNMISAPPNGWKSWWLFLYAKHIVTGTSLFGKFATEKNNVMIVNEEDIACLIQDRLKLLNLTDPSLSIFYRIAQGSKLTDEFVDNLIKEAKEKNIGVIMFDSLRAIHDAEENSSQEMQKVLDRFKRINREGITVIFTHHNKKKNGFMRADDAEMSRGSSAINASISGHIALEEFEKDGEKFLIVKHLKTKAGKKLSDFDISIKISDSGIDFEYLGDHKPKEQALNEAVAGIIYELERRDELLGRKDFKHLKIGGDTAIKMATKLLANGKEGVKEITRAEAIKRGLKLFNPVGKSNELLYFIEKDSGLNPPDISQIESC